MYFVYCDKKKPTLFSKLPDLIVLVLVIIKDMFYFSMKNHVTTTLELPEYGISIHIHISCWQK